MNYPTNTQRYILESGVLTSGFNCILRLPTGSGKTWLLEQAVKETINSGFRVIYISPTKALANEIYMRWKSLFDIKVGIFTSDFLDKNSLFPTTFCEAKVLIMTPERLDLCLRRWRYHWDWLPEVDCLAIDEFHLIGESIRGARLEASLCRFNRINPFARIIGVSATLGNVNELSGWLNAVNIESDERIIPLNFKYRYFSKASEKENLVLDEINDSSIDCRILIFTQSRKRVKNLYEILINNGISCSYHHGGLDTNDRNNIESKFREGNIKVLVCTSTLEVGVNLPASKVILYDLQFFNGTDFTPLTVNQVWQRAGRAGRPGFDSEGEVILISPKWDKESKRYPMGIFEPIKSKLTSEQIISEQIIIELYSRLSRTKDEIVRSFQTTLSAYQKILPNIDNILKKLISVEMIEENFSERFETTLKVTKLGRIACRHMLLPDTVEYLSRFNKEILFFSYFDLLLVFTCSREIETILYVDYEELIDLENILGPIPSSLLSDGIMEFQNIANISNKRLLSGIKMAVILRSLCDSELIDTLAERHDCFIFEIIRLKESVLKHIIAAISIWNIKDDNKDDFNTNEEYNDNLLVKVFNLKNMLISGLGQYQSQLLLLDSLGVKTLNILINNGIHDLEDIAQTTQETLCKIRGISKKRANDWIEQSETLIKGGLGELIWEPALNIPTKTNKTKKQDIYRIKRSYDLEVIEYNDKKYEVKGGTDPHFIFTKNNSHICDCPDFMNGNKCKHIIAVKRVINNSNQPDKILTGNKSTSGESIINLYDLWCGDEYIKKIA